MDVRRVGRGGGTNSDDFEGDCSGEGTFIFKNFVVDAFAQSLSYGSSGVVYPYPAAGHVFGETKKRIQEGRVSSVCTSDCEGVLFTHELVGVLLFSGKVAIGEMVAVEALMDSVVGAVEDGEE